MTIALLRSNVAVKSHTGGKAVKERSENGNKLSKYFLKTDLREASLNKDPTSNQKFERRAPDVNCLEMTDAATETYFSDGVSIPPENNSTSQSPFSDFSTGVSLDSVCPVCRAEQAIANVKVYISNCSYQVHKCAVVSKSAYLRRELSEADEIKLPSEFPGGVETFEVVIDFCKGSTILMEPSNVAALRCAAEFLEMDEKQCRQNLSERTDKYLNEVVLQSWMDTSKVLQKCADLLPLAEETFVVSRCIESLAFTACVELLEHEEWEELRACQSSESHSWSEKTSSSGLDASAIWWITDLINVPFMFFVRILKAFRKQGMSEKYVSLSMIKCVQSWFFSDWLGQNNNSEESMHCSSPERCSLLEDIVRLVPFVKYAVPVGFLFSFLRCAILLKASNDCRMHLEKRIASQLELATVNEFLIPSDSLPHCTHSRLDLDSMVRIVSIFVSQNAVCSVDSLSSQEVSAVSKVWDEYLAHICVQDTIDAKSFADLVEAFPAHLRLDHDQLYRTINVYLKAHPQISQEERSLVCRTLNCQKLSQEACIHAVQNEYMPLRMIVQAMFVQHIQTRKVLNNQLRICNGMNFESLPPSGQLLSPHKKILSRFSRTDPLRFACSEEIGLKYGRLPLGRSPDTKVAHLQATFLKSDLEETNDRLQNLEGELACMKRALSEACIGNRAFAHQAAIAGSGFQGLEAASNLFNSKSKRGFPSRRAGMENAHRSNRVGQSLVKSIFQKMGIGSFCKSRNEQGYGYGAPNTKIVTAKRLQDGDEVQSQADKIASWDDGMAFHPSMELKTRKQNHSRHHSFA